MSQLDTAIHLRSVSLNTPAQGFPDGFPYTVPVIRSLASLNFTATVTFLVGENGSGKSTFLETLALAANLPTVGSEESGIDSTLQALRPLAKLFKLSWALKKHRGFFLRAEDFFGFVKRLAAMRESMLQDLAQVDQDYVGRSKTAHDLARMPYRRELYDMQQRYGESLDAYSHGESFFKFFRARLIPGGLYLMDEPEAPLSPSRQIVLLMMLQEMIAQRSQFIIATHSPILLALPGAAIWRFDRGQIISTAYDDLEHVVVMREFLRDPAQYLAKLTRLVEAPDDVP